MRKIAVMVLLSLVFVSITQTLSFAIEPELGRNTEPSNSETMRAATATLAGAATGAAIGSVIPVVGTATGAVIGAIAGSVASWFSGR